jgi:iron complex outermembrane receptor protein
MAARGCGHSYLYDFICFCRADLTTLAVKIQKLQKPKPMSVLPAAKTLILLAFVHLQIVAHAQVVDTLQSKPLEEVIIKAYDQNKNLRDVAAPVSYVNQQTLQRFSPVSIVKAINTTPGVRMEERSPGSYRINIRGSSLRSPFGVRNVKIYYNDIPITNPGGHSYLNQLGYYNFNSIEIIKGPGSSLYGAGTGGVLLIESMDEKAENGVMVAATTGSYGMQNLYGNIILGNDKQQNIIGYQHLQSDGYRNHSALKRDVVNWDGCWQVGARSVLKTTFLYGHLFYETPGALTQKDYEADPKAARPGNAFFPGAEAAQASITQKTFLAGFSLEQRFSEKWKNKTAAYGMFTELRNPNIQGFDRNSEPHAGARSSFQFSQPLSDGSFKAHVGGEWQQGFTTLSNFKNVGGLADSLRSYDEVFNRQSMLFAQASLDHKSWTLTAGASINFFKLQFERFSPQASGQQERAFNNQLAPRVALLKKFENFSVYASVSEGFSPPSTTELLPTGGAINLDLIAEDGINYDIGFKGTLLKKMYVDVNAFIFSVQNTIVQRRTAGGGDYFVNAGKTNQKGIETYIHFPLATPGSILDKSNFWLSHAWHHFQYKSFNQLGNDYSGNRLPASAPHTVAAGADLSIKNNWQFSASYYYSGRIPLNDANSAYADAYQVVDFKVGYRHLFKQKVIMNLFVGADNVLDEKYSLGNDVNGFGGRYYNAAPARSYYAGIILKLKTGPTERK